jgi:general secretion pathway protein M
MNALANLEKYLARIPHAAALAYVAVLLALGFATWGAIDDVLATQSAAASSADILSRLEGRVGSRPGSAAEFSPTSGSPFVEGSTVTVAGAALLQRIAGAVTQSGGNVLSSEVELQGSQAKPGFISVVVSCELEQPALQQLLYDLESGMPFIFVDQLVVQAPTAAASRPAGKLRILLGISSQWEAAK